jgi:transcriptional regulator with XRE-family HTH domain
MTLNVYHTHNSVKRNCAYRAITGAAISAYNVDMSAKSLKSRHKTYMREWRTFRRKTLVQVAETLGITHGQLSRIERGEQPYNQDLLEQLADLYMCDVPDLIMRNPKDPAAIWSLWDQAQPGERAQISAVAETIVKFRAQGGK